MEKWTRLLPLLLAVLVISGCAPALRMDSFQTVIPEIQMRKKYPMKVALIIPAASQANNMITISRSKCIGGISEVAPSPFGNTFKETAVGAFSKMFSDVDVIQGFPVEKNYDLIIEASLTSLSFKNGCQDDPGNYFKAEGSVKLFDNDYREIWSNSQDTLHNWAYWTSVPADTVISNLLSLQVKGYAQNLNNSPLFVQFVKERNKLKEQSAAGESRLNATLAPSVRSDVDDPLLVKIRRVRNSYAIVIGIEQYRQKLPAADFATQDAKLVADYLTKSLGYPEENVITLLNDHATNVDLVKYLEKWLPNNVEKDSTVFIYYSGHGAPDPKTGSAYLVPYDGDPSFIDQTGYSLRRMYEALGRLPAKEVIVALDSCFSGAGGRSVLAEGARPLVMNLHKTNALPANMVVMAASSSDQISSTYKDKGHGLFTYFMLKGIRNEDVVRPDGSIRMDDLFGYIKPQVERIARKQYNNEQTPQLIGAKN